MGPKLKAKIFIHGGCSCKDMFVVNTVVKDKLKSNLFQSNFNSKGVAIFHRCLVCALLIFGQPAFSSCFKLSS